MIRKRRWPDLLLPFAVPVLAAGIVSLLLVLAVPVRHAGRTPHATVPQPAISDITIPESLLTAGKAVVAADPFAGDRKAPPRRSRTAASGRPAAIGGRMPATASRLALVGLLTDPAGPIAVLRDETSGETALLRTGEAFHGLRLRAVDDLSVRLEGPGGKVVTLTLSFRKAAGSRASGATPRAVPRARSRPRRPHPVTGGARAGRRVAPATVATPTARRDGFGRPKPARRFRARRADVRTWQRKLEDYGVTGNPHRAAPPPPAEPPRSAQENSDPSR